MTGTFHRLLPAYALLRQPTGQCPCAEVLLRGSQWSRVQAGGAGRGSRQGAQTLPCWPCRLALHLQSSQVLHLWSVRTPRFRNFACEAHQWGAHLQPTNSPRTWRCPERLSTLVPQAAARPTGPARFSVTLSMRLVHEQATSGMAAHLKSHHPCFAVVLKPLV